MYRRWLYRVPFVAAIIYSTAHLEYLQTLDWLPKLIRGPLQQDESDSLGLARVGDDFCDSFVALLSRISFWIGFWRAPRRKRLLPPQWEHDFGNIAIIAKTLT